MVYSQRTTQIWVGSGCNRNLKFSDKGSVPHRPISQPLLNSNWLLQQSAVDRRCCRASSRCYKQKLFYFLSRYKPKTHATTWTESDTKQGGKQLQKHLENTGVKGEDAPPSLFSRGIPTVVTWLRLHSSPPLPSLLGNRSGAPRRCNAAQRELWTLKCTRSALDAFRKRNKANYVYLWCLPLTVKTQRLEFRRPCKGKGVVFSSWCLKLFLSTTRTLSLCSIRL